MGLFKTLFVLALIDRYATGGALPGQLSLLGGNPGFWVVTGLGIAESIIDMIPGADVKWDRWTGHLRVAGAIIISYIVLESEPASSRVIMAIVGGCLALFAYSARAAARIAAQRSGTNVIVSPIASITEDCLIFATLLPLTQLFGMTILLLVFLTTAAMLIMYIAWADARSAMKHIVRF